MLIDFTAILATLGVAQALFLSAYFFTLKQGKRSANVLLALVLLGLSIRIAKSVFNHYYDIAPWLRNLGLSGMLICGPSFWLYGCILSNHQFKLKLATLWHFFPAGFYVGFSWLIPNQKDSPSAYSYSFVLLHFLTYLLLSAYIAHHKLTDKSMALVSWYRRILAGLLFIWSYLLLVFVKAPSMYIGAAVFYSALVYAFSYMLLKRHVLVLDKYSQSELSHAQAKALVERFKTQMIRSRAYLNPRYGLQEAAESLACNSRDLSRAINEQAQCNFSQWLNRHRIELAQKKLSNDSDPPSKIAVIARECGFGNTTSFNAEFKRITGVTPSEFRRERIKNNQKS